MKNIRAVSVLIGLALFAKPSVAIPQEEVASPQKGQIMTKIIDFSTGSPTWRSIDDVVMGGRSFSRMKIENGIGVFAGTVSLANNGGFASVRSLPADHDLSAFGGLVLKVKGDGRRYKIRLRTTASFDGVSYQASIAPPAGRWHEMALDFGLFEPVYRGVEGSRATKPSTQLVFRRSAC